MPSLAILVDLWDEAHRELDIALSGVPNRDLWKRAHPALLSIGEIAAHIAYWQIIWTMGGGEARPDFSSLAFQSPLLDERIRYYTANIESEAKLDIGTVELIAEVNRCHAAAREIAAAKRCEDAYAGQWGTWGNFVKYQCFHVAYHAGQIYSARHLLGHETEDN